MEDLFSRPDFLRVVADADPNLIIVKDRHGRFRFVNQTAAEYHGVRPEDMIGKLESEFYKDQSLPGKYAAEDELVYRLGERVDFGERQTVDNLGRARWLRSTKIPLRNDNGDIDGVVLVVTDVTFGLEAQKKEQRISAGLRALVSTSEELLSCPDVDCLIERAVTLARERLGLERVFIYRTTESGLEGTYGTTLDGETVDERGVPKPLDCYRELLEQTKHSQPASKVFNFPRKEHLPGREEVTVDGWLCVTLMKSHQQPLGVFIYDSEITNTPFNDALQEVVLTYATMVATLIERKIAELDATERDRQFRQLFEQSPTANAIISLTGTITVCNESFARLVRTNSSADALELDGKALLGRDQFRFFVKMLRKYATLDNYETAINLPDGSAVPVVLNISARADKEGELNGFHAMLMDVSEQKALEAALEELDRGTGLRGDGSFFLELVRHVSEAMSVKGAFVLEIISLSSSNVKTLGGIWEGQPMDGREFPIEGSGCENVLLKGYYAQLTSLRRHHPGYAAYDELKADAYMGVLLKSTDGVPLGVLAAVHDRPLAREERLRPILQIFASRASAEIQRRRADEKLQKSQAEFLQMQKMEAVGRLAGGIAHDFNNILTSILGISDLILFDLEKGTTMYDDIEQIKKSAERAAGLTRQLLAFSRKQVMQTQVLNINDLITGMRKIMKPLLGERITLTLNLASEEMLIKADQGQIEQALLNIIINARDAIAGSGKITITTSVHLEAGLANSPMKQGEYVRISVQDTGFGMDSETLGRVFEPFFTTKPKGQGTGLGLPTVYGIVSQSRGHIDIESSPGAGTTVHISLPQAPSQSRAAVAPAEAPIVGGSEIILLVEDEDEVRAPLKAVLTRSGYTVLEAKNGGEAFLILEKDIAIDLMVSDVAMPHLTGPELYERVAPSRPRMKVLFISGFGDEDFVAHLQRDGVRNFLQKPFSPPHFLEHVRAILDS